jgi:hypothetical protein
LSVQVLVATRDITMIERAESNPASIIERYRDVIALLDAVPDERCKAEWQGVARRLRDRWKEWRGEDSLHEMAFGEPLPTSAARTKGMKGKKGFLVKANRPACVSWLSAHNDHGERSLVSREHAAMFPTITAARAAIAKMPQALKNASVMFLVQSAP